MYARRYPPPTDEITVPENYSGNQFPIAEQENEDDKDETELEDSAVSAAEANATGSDFSEEAFAAIPKPSRNEQTEDEPFSVDNVLLLLALLLSENSLGENIEFFLLLLLLI